MSTTCFETTLQPRQLSFAWSDSTETKVATQAKTGTRKARTNDGTEAKRSSSISLAAPAPSSETSLATPRTGKPVHISGLMAAVLARYGIDASEFESLAIQQ